MKLFYNANGRLTDIHDKEFLVQGNDGVNIIEIYGPWNTSSIVTICFKRADGFIIGELETKRELDHWYFAIENKWNILNIPGQIQMTVSVYHDGTKQNLAMYTSHVYGAITIKGDEHTAFEWYVAEKLIEHSEQISIIKESIGNLKLVEIIDEDGGDISNNSNLRIEYGALLEEAPSMFVFSAPPVPDLFEPEDEVTELEDEVIDLMVPEPEPEPELELELELEPEVVDLMEPELEPEVVDLTSPTSPLVDNDEVINLINYSEVIDLTEGASI